MQDLNSKQKLWHVLSPFPVINMNTCPSEADSQPYFNTWLY